MTGTVLTIPHTVLILYSCVSLVFMTGTVLTIPHTVLILY
jgi:hypothetical protein